MAILMGSLSCCWRPVELLLQCIGTGSRRCCSQLQRLLQLLLQLLFHMKPVTSATRMGCTWSRLWTGRRNCDYQIRMLLVGRRFAGKTALVYRLKLGVLIPTKPSVGSNTELFSLHLQRRHGSPFAAAERQETEEDLLRLSLSDVENGAGDAQNTTVKVAICDVAGGDGETLEWQGLQKGCDCVCFALDSTASLMAVEDARREFLELFYDEQFVLCRDTPFLVLATKQDLCNARSAAEVERLLELPEEVKETCQVVGCSSLSGEGLLQVQQWLAAVAVSLAKSNSSLSSPDLRGKSLYQLAACNSNSFGASHEEMVLTSATASRFPSQAEGAEGEGDKDTLRETLNSPPGLLLQERVSPYVHLLDES